MTYIHEKEIELVISCPFHPTVPLSRATTINNYAECIDFIFVCQKSDIQLVCLDTCESILQMSSSI